MTLVKICGITRESDARFCTDAGVDFLGLVFAPRSPRLVSTAAALSIVAAAGERRPAIVGVFRDQPLEEVRDLAARVPLDFVQLHGDESDEYAAAVGLPVIKAVPVGESLPAMRPAEHASWLLFDRGDPLVGGGTGRTFDWALLRRSERRRPFFLAGGLTPANVALAIATVGPDAVDVSSGVESAPGIKDHAKISRFLEEAGR